MMTRKTLLAAAVSIFFVTGVYAQGNSTSTTTSTTATTAKTSKPTFRSTKEQVEKAQTMLKEKKLYGGEVTGKSGTEWKTAVKNYQSENGLTKTGSLNRATLEKMGIELTEKQKLIPVSASSIASSSSKTKTAKPAKATSSTASTSSSSGDKPKKPAPFRANEDQIKAAQKMLKDGKMYTGEETGKLDTATREALMKYKETNGLKVSNTLNAETLEKMGIALTDAQKANVAAAAAYAAGSTPKN